MKTQKDEQPKQGNSANPDIDEDKQKSCFIIMPISDQPGYDPGHFTRVYEYIIKPACKAAGFEPVRADDVYSTNVIVIDILKKITESDMAICDLSANNPNVLYELGIRQSFDKPVTLIKDDVTSRIFDIQSFRAIPYSKSLRFDEVTNAVTKLTTSLVDTYVNKGKEVNSIVELMGISRASVKDPVELSPDTSILLDAIRGISQRLNVLEQPSYTPKQLIANAVGASKTVTSIGRRVQLSGYRYQQGDILDSVFLGDGSSGKVGDIVKSVEFGLGKIIDLISSDVYIIAVCEFEGGTIGVLPESIVRYP